VGKKRKKIKNVSHDVLFYFSFYFLMIAKKKKEKKSIRKPTQTTIIIVIRIITITNKIDEILTPSHIQTSRITLHPNNS